MTNARQRCRMEKFLLKKILQIETLQILIITTDDAQQRCRMGLQIETLQILVRIALKLMRYQSLQILVRIILKLYLRLEKL